MNPYRPDYGMYNKCEKLTRTFEGLESEILENIHKWSTQTVPMITNILNAYESLYKWHVFIDDQVKGREQVQFAVDLRPSSFVVHQTEKDPSTGNERDTQRAVMVRGAYLSFSFDGYKTVTIAYYNRLVDWSDTEVDTYYSESNNAHLIEQFPIHKYSNSKVESALVHFLERNIEDLKSK